MRRGDDAEEMYHKEQWAEFIDAAEREIATGWKEPCHWWTMLAHAYRKLGKRAEARKALESGVQRHPDEALPHAFLGTCLAGESAGKPEVRQEAIRLWNLALKKQEGRHSTFDHLRKEILVLKALPEAEPYPPVSKPVRKYLVDLKECGLFENLTVEEVLSRAIDELGSDVVHDKRRGIRESLLCLDTPRYLFSDWRYAAGELLGDVSRLLAPHRVQLAFERETDPDKDGVRNVTFSIAGESREHTVDAADAVVRAVNERLVVREAPVRFYQMNKNEGSDGYWFLLLRPTEAAAIKQKKLVDIDLP